MRQGKISIERALEGGCLCGAVRYRVAPCEGDSGYCHCRLCQRSAGAPALAWIGVPRTCLVVTSGTPRSFRSSSHASREFCPTCGTQLFFSDDGAPTIDFTTTSLDDPAQTPPAPRPPRKPCQ
jgi:hypothetical protein